MDISGPRGGFLEAIRHQVQLDQTRQCHKTCHFLPCQSHHLCKMSEDYQVMISRQILCQAIKYKIIISHIFCKIHISYILQIGKKTFSGTNFRNMARMHNSTDYVTFIEKSLTPFLRKVSKTIYLISCKLAKKHF